MRRYFSVKEIKWKPGKQQGADWHVAKFNNLPTDINFISLEDPVDIDEAFRATFLETYGYNVESYEYTELSEEEADKQAIFVLLGGCF